MHQKLLQRLRCQCVMQILERGFHHADPHPGNLLRMSGDRLAYIDFGMMGDIQTGVRRQASACSCAHMVYRLLLGPLLNCMQQNPPLAVAWRLS